MQKSARVLGAEHGMTAEEMNCLLFLQGFLKGEPGDYEPTEKALEYVIEKGEHRGPGGYPFYNRDWIKRTFDETIVAALDLSPDMIKAAKDAAADHRAAKRAARMAEPVVPPVECLPVVKKTAEDIIEQSQIQKANNLDWNKTAKYGLIIGGGFLLAYGFYKAAPKIKQWWKSMQEDYINTSI